MTKLLSSAPDDHASRVEKLLQFQKTAAKELKNLQKELAASIARDLVARTSEGVVTYHREEGISVSCKRCWVFWATQK